MCMHLPTFTQALATCTYVHTWQVTQISHTPIGKLAGGPRLDSSGRSCRFWGANNFDSIIPMLTECTGNTKLTVVYNLFIAKENIGPVMARATRPAPPVLHTHTCIIAMVTIYTSLESQPTSEVVWLLRLYLHISYTQAP